MKSKHLFLILFAVCSFCFPNKTFCKDYLILQLKSNAVVGFELESRPSIKFEKGNVTVSDRIFTFSEVARYTFGDESQLGIVSPEIDNLWYVGPDGTVTIPISADPESIAVYDLNGISIPVDISIESAGIKVNFSELPTGVYILKAGSKSLKICKQ